MKRLSAESLADKELIAHGISDLALEARFLSVLQHPNIIKMRAFASTDLCSDGFFIILDRLYDTLEITISKWRQETIKHAGFMCCMADKEKADELFHDRLHFAWDLATAMEHIHNQK